MTAPQKEFVLPNMENFDLEAFDLETLDLEELEFGGNNNLSDLLAMYQNFTNSVDLELIQVIKSLEVYVIPIIIIIGVIGNTISFLVYVCTPQLSRQSSSIYLIFLAVVDNGFLVSLFAVWFGWVEIYDTMQKNGWCQTMFYSKYVCSFLSVWTVVSFTVERWIVVFHPLKRHQLCTCKRALIVMICLTLFSLVFYSYSIVTTRIHYVQGTPLCMPAPEYHNFLRVITFIDTVITVILPCLAIVIMNTGIGIKIIRYTNSKKSGPGTNPSGDEMSNLSVLKSNGESLDFSTHNATRTSILYQNQTIKIRPWRFLTKRHHTQIRITKALLVVSSLFVILNLPSSLLRIHIFVLSIKEEKLKHSTTLTVYQFLHFFYYIKFSSTFFLYVICSRNFRHALKRLSRRAWHKIRNLSAQRYTALYNMFVNRQAKHG